MKYKKIIALMTLMLLLQNACAMDNNGDNGDYNFHIYEENDRRFKEVIGLVDEYVYRPFLKQIIPRIVNRRILRGDINMNQMLLDGNNVPLPPLFAGVPLEIITVLAFLKLCEDH